ncbi:AlpA family transcriptional regulator [Chitinivorax sp. PXF-14]|uniref:helix-turn-helix transcriptional regulator n=1 Tax=Chitinivorax sp. PXF-14 TaxID=3230488 RepID=UPI0034659F78
MKPQHVKQATPQVEVTHIPSIDPLLRLPDVEAATGFKRSHIYALMARGDFPRTIRIGTNAVAWRLSDIAMWIAGRVEAA